MKKEKWKTFVTDRWKVAAPGLLAAFAVCFIFFIYAPLELYVTCLLYTSDAADD